MSSSVNRLAFIKVYKDLQRIATQFPQYSYRNFARRRIRDYFEANKSADASNQSALYEEALNAVQSLKRQVQVSKQYPYRPLVIEQKKN
ncbi:Complex1-LYR-dom domain-containing protein [Aphelenchoides bicaudatus]|nr:Complex1-LYR-dom domain-containing protein [Aphelenchoides bicaudatus]